MEHWNEAKIKDFAEVKYGENAIYEDRCIMNFLSHE